jgi:hypothetical protein
VIFQEHDFVVANPDAFKKGVAITESAVVKRNTGFVNTDEVTVQYAILIFAHCISAI